MGTLLFMQGCVPHMRGHDASIVNIASGAGPMAAAGMGPYAAGKEAIRTLSRVAAVELGPEGIRVNVVCPIAWAPSFEAWADEDRAEFDALIERTPLRRIGDPVTDVGAAIAFLAGAESRYITGTTLMVDGGSTYLR
jgi:NAD(P)-dependent dehydrogenase (short-subunit alcohol dehydrogenase family)